MRFSVSFATLVFVAATLLTGAVWISAAISMRDAQHSFNLSSQAVRTFTGDAPKSSFTEAELSYSRDPTRGLITVHLSRVSLSNRQLEATVFLDIPETAMHMFTDRQTHKSIDPTMFTATYGALDFVVLIQTVNDLPIRLVQPLSNFVFEPSSPSIPHGGLYGIMGPVTLGVTGLPHAFPQDSYNALVEARGPFLPDRLAYAATPDELLAYVPNLYQVSQDLNLSDYTITNSFLATGQVLVSVNRTAVSQLFTFAVGLMPVLLAVILLHLIWTRELDIVDTLKLLFAALFTILPLRVVLVPADIGGLTLLDGVLGAEVMLLLMVGALAYWRDVWRRPRRRSAARDGDHAGSKRLDELVTEAASPASGGSEVHPGGAAAELVRPHDVPAESPRPPEPAGKRAR